MTPPHDPRRENLDQHATHDETHHIKNNYQENQHQEALIEKLEHQIFCYLKALPPEHPLKGNNNLGPNGKERYNSKGGDPHPRRLIDILEFQKILQDEGVPPFHPVLFLKLAERIPPLNDPNSVDVVAWVGGENDQGGGGRKEKGPGRPSAKKFTSRTQSGRIVAALDKAKIGWTTLQFSIYYLF